MVDLTGLAAFGTGVFPGQVQARDARLSLRAKEMDLRARQQDLDADRAIFSALSSGDQLAIPYAQIQQPPLPQPTPMAPGQPSVPSGPTGPGGMPGRAMGPAVGAPGGPPGAPSPAPTGPVQPVMPQMGGGLNIRDMARRIEQANPGLDKATLFRALVKGTNILDPESKMAMQYAMNVMRLEGKLAAIQGRLEQSQINNDTKIYIANMLDEMRRDIAAGQRSTTERGQDIRADTAATAEAGRETRAGARAAAKAPSQEYNTFNTQLRSTQAQIADLIRENGGMVPTPGSKNWDKYTTLKARRDALFDKMVEARKKSERAGPMAAEPDSDMPPQDPSTLDEGTIATKGDVTFIVKAGKWVRQ